MQTLSEVPPERAAEIAELVSRSDGEINAETITKWLKQFGRDELPPLFRILTALRFYSSSKVHAMVRELHRSIQTSIGVSTDRQWFVPIGYVAKSGSAIAFFYKKQNDLPASRFVMATDLTPAYFSDDSAVIFLDDFIGSGHQSVQFWAKVVEPILPKHHKCKLVLGTLVGYDFGIAHVKNSTGLTPVVVDVLSDADRPFSAASTIFANPAEREFARQVVRKYGERLYPKHPAGYADSQSLIGFFYSTPNNSLPILWSTEGGWAPLLPRAEVLRDPADMVGPSSVASREDAALLLSLSEDAELDAIPEEIASQMVREFKSLRTASDIGVIFNRLGARPSTFARLIELIQKLKYFKHEKEPVCSALLLVGNNSTVGEQLFARAGDDVGIDATEELLSLAQLVDGYSGALVMCANGLVLGDCLYPESASATALDYAVPERCQRAAGASRILQGLLFLFDGGGRVSLFHNGARLLVHRGSTWHRTTIDSRVLSALALSHQLKTSVLESVLRLAFNLSDLGAGALITVGDEHEVQRYSDPPTTAHVRWTQMSVENTPNAAILPLLHQDGATIIAADGAVVQGMTFLRPPTGIQAVEEVGKGSKHSTAAKISKITKAIVVAVSVDGRITVFSNGEHALKRMG